jgi:hypothetical protein
MDPHHGGSSARTRDAWGGVDDATHALAWQELQSWLSKFSHFLAKFYQNMIF